GAGPASEAIGSARAAATTDAMSNWLVFMGTLLIFAGSVTVAVPDGSPLGRRGPDVLLPWTRPGTGAVRGRGPAPSRPGPGSTAGGAYLNHLLPLPYTEESLAIVTAHVARVQERLRRRILVENPSGYLRFEHSTLEEAEFLTALAQRTGCGLLCDVNNIHVT